ncbi:MAG TPA: hypothetical protein VGK47_08860 [Nitrososphaeraceae archaeon]
MCKELWIEAYNSKIEEIMQKHDMVYEEADELLKMVLETNPRYLDGYMGELIDFYAMSY